MQVYLFIPSDGKTRARTAQFMTALSSSLLYAPYCRMGQNFLICSNADPSDICEAYAEKYLTGRLIPISLNSIEDIELP